MYISNAPFETEWERRMPIIYPFDALLGLGNSTAGSSANLFTPRVSLESTVAPAVGANKLCEMVEEADLDMYSSPAYVGVGDTHFWARPSVVSVQMAVEVKDSPTSTSFIGLELGSFNSGPPFSNTPASPIIQLRARLDTLVWQLLTAKGNGVSSVATLTGGTVQLVHKLKIIYSPGQYVAGIVDGVELFRQTVASNLPDTTFVPPIPFTNVGKMAGVFVTSGTSVNGHTIGSFQSLMRETIGMP